MFVLGVKLDKLGLMMLVYVNVYVVGVMTLPLYIKSIHCSYGADSGFVPSKAYICARLFAGITVSNSVQSLGIRLLCVLCVV
jgi:hypothetical protein